MTTLSVRTFLVLVLAVPVVSWAEDQILCFHSDVTVNEDASLSVKETLTVRLEDRADRGADEGIRRKVPVVSWDRLGFRHMGDVGKAAAQCDGTSTSCRMDYDPFAVFLHVGEHRAAPPPGEHTFTFTYRVDRAFRHFRDRDELRWSVGNAGTDQYLPILDAGVTIHFPHRTFAGDIVVSASAGGEGLSGEACVVNNNSSKDLVLSAERYLTPRETFCLVARLPKGMITDPVAARCGRFVRDNAGSFTGFCGVAALLLWYRASLTGLVRRGTTNTPASVTVVPQDFSPAALRYVLRMGFDVKAFAAALVSMAVKGYLTIEERYGVFLLRRGDSDTALTAEEDAITRRLSLASPVKIEVHRRGALQKAQEACHAELDDAYQGVYFAGIDRNTVRRAWWLSLAVLVSMAGIQGGLSGTGGIAAVVAGVVTGGFWCGLVGLFVHGEVVPAWKAVLLRRSGSLLPAVGLTLFAAPFVAVGMLFISLPFAIAGPHSVPVAVLLVFINIAAGRWLRMRTAGGRQVLRQTRAFMRVLGGRDANTRNLDVNEIPSTLERYLPYAIALDAERTWSRWLADSAEATGWRPRDVQWAPHWYSGDRWPPTDLSRFAPELSGALTNALRAALAKPPSLCQPRKRRASPPSDLPPF